RVRSRPPCALVETRLRLSVDGCFAARSRVDLAPGVVAPALRSVSPSPPVDALCLAVAIPAGVATTRTTYGVQLHGAFTLLVPGRGRSRAARPFELSRAQ